MAPLLTPDTEAAELHERRKSLVWIVVAIFVGAVTLGFMGSARGLISWGFTLVAWVVAVRMMREPVRDLRSYLRRRHS
jgi:hypothetical protein